MSGPSPAAMRLLLTLADRPRDVRRQQIAKHCSRDVRLWLRREDSRRLLAVLTGYAKDERLPRLRELAEQLPDPDAREKWLRACDQHEAEAR